MLFFVCHMKVLTSMASQLAHHHRCYLQEKRKNQYYFLLWQSKWVQDDLDVSMILKLFYMNLVNEDLNLLIKLIMPDLTSVYSKYY